MKYFALIFVALVAVCYADVVQLNDEQNERVRTAGKACIAEEGTTAEAIQPIRNGNFESATQKEKCFINCFLGKMGLTVEGVPQENVITQKLGAIIGEEKANEIQKECNGEHGADNCDTAFKLYQCYYKNNAGLA